MARRARLSSSDWVNHPVPANAFAGTRAATVGFPDGRQDSSAPQLKQWPDGPASVLDQAKARSTLNRIVNVACARR